MKILKLTTIAFVVLIISIILIKYDDIEKIEINPQEQKFLIGFYQQKDKFETPNISFDQIYELISYDDRSLLQELRYSNDFIVAAGRQSCNYVNFFDHESILSKLKLIEVTLSDSKNISCISPTYFQDQCHSDSTLPFLEITKDFDILLIIRLTDQGKNFNNYLQKEVR